MEKKRKFEEDEDFSNVFEEENKDLLNVFENEEGLMIFPQKKSGVKLFYFEDNEMVMNKKYKKILEYFEKYYDNNQVNLIIDGNHRNYFICKLLEKYSYKFETHNVIKSNISVIYHIVHSLNENICVSINGVKTQYLTYNFMCQEINKMTFNKNDIIEIFLKTNNHFIYNMNIYSMEDNSVLINKMSSSTQFIVCKEDIEKNNQCINLNMMNNFDFMSKIKKKINEYYFMSLNEIFRSYVNLMYENLMDKMNEIEEFENKINVFHKKYVDKFNCIYFECYEKMLLTKLLKINKKENFKTVFLDFIEKVFDKMNFDVKDMFKNNIKIINENFNEEINNLYCKNKNQMFSKMMNFLKKQVNKNLVFEDLLCYEKLIFYKEKHLVDNYDNYCEKLNNYYFSLKIYNELF